MQLTEMILIKVFLFDESIEEYKLRLKIIKRKKVRILKNHYGVFGMVIFFFLQIYGSITYKIITQPAARSNFTLTS